MTFRDPIIKGSGALVRQAIKSPNYVAGTSGWSINKDGSAEFADVTVRGDVVADDGFATGDALEARVEVTDAAGGDLLMYSASQTDYSGKIAGFAVAGTPVGHALRIEGADVHATRSPPLIILENKDDSDHPSIEIFGEDNNDHFIRVKTDLVALVGGNVERIKVDHDEVTADADLWIDAGHEIGWYAAASLADKAGRMRAVNVGNFQWLVLEGEDIHPTKDRPRLLIAVSDQSGDDPSIEIGLEGNAEVKVSPDRIDLTDGEIYGSSSISTSSTAGQALHYNTSTGEIFRYTP